MGGGNFPGLFASPPIYEANILVLARGSEHISVVAPDKVLSELLVAFESVDSLSLLYVPNLDGLVSTARSEDIVSGGVKPEEGDLAAVALEVDEGLGDVFCQTALRDLPQLDSGIIGSRGYHVIIKGVPIKIQNAGGVALNLGDGAIEPAGRGAKRRLGRLFYSI
jgi:hypothetical protein